jgi:hypothetical protein
MKTIRKISIWFGVLLTAILAGTIANGLIDGFANTPFLILILGGIKLIFNIITNLYIICVTSGLVVGYIVGYIKYKPKIINNSNPDFEYNIKGITFITNRERLEYDNISCIHDKCKSPCKMTTFSNTDGGYITCITCGKKFNDINPHQILSKIKGEYNKHLNNLPNKLIFFK